MSSNSENSEDFLAKWLSGEITPEQKAEFESTEEGKQLLDVLNSVEKMAFPAYNVEAELVKLKQTQEAHKSSAKVRNLAPFWRMAVAAVLVIGIGLVYFLTSPNYEVFNTTYSETRTITLPDSSIVTLNVNSTLQYNSKEFASNRKLLLGGEAFFEVTKGLNFQVETEEGTVRVLGTSFNVKQRTKNLEVQVYTGVVNVMRDKIDRILNRGDGLKIKDGTLAKSWSTSVPDKPLWVTENIVVLEDVPMSEALEALRNSFGITIETDISLTSERFTGSYPGDNVEMAIQIVLSTNQIEYEYDSANKKLTITGTAGN